jgi:hypothetical protein
MLFTTEWSPQRKQIAKHIQKFEQPVTVRAAEKGRVRALATPRKAVDQSDCANKQTTTVRGPNPNPTSKP